MINIIHLIQKFGDSIGLSNFSEILSSLGVNPSKSAHFILFPLTSSHIFAGKNGDCRALKRQANPNSMKTSHINFFYVIEMAKLFKIFSI